MKHLAKVIIVLLCFVLLAPGTHAASLSGTDGILEIELLLSGQPQPGIKVNICRVASVAEVSGKLAYTLTNDFAAAGVVLPQNGVLTAGENRDLSLALDDYAVSSGLSRPYKVTDAAGKILFTDLIGGMYLVSQTDAETGNCLMTPVLVPVPYEHSQGRSYSITAHPKTQEHGSSSSSGSSSVPSSSGPSSSGPSSSGPSSSSGSSSSSSTSSTPSSSFESSSESSSSREVPDTDRPRPDRPSPPVPPPKPPIGHTLVPDGDGYIEIDGNGVPLGRWTYDPDQGMWIFDEFPPLANLPRTSVLRWPIPVLGSAGALLIVSGFIVRRRRNGL